MRRADRDQPVHATIFPAITLVVLVSVGTVGATLLGPLQLYGGIAGLVMFGVPFTAAI